jgi:hypothetical protein
MRGDGHAIRVLLEWRVRLVSGFDGVRHGSTLPLAGLSLATLPRHVRQGCDTGHKTAVSLAVVAPEHFPTLQATVTEPQRDLADHSCLTRPDVPRLDEVRRQRGQQQCLRRAADWLGARDDGGDSRDPCGSRDRTAE